VTETTKETGVLGTVYLLHFSKPYKHARHYVGWTAGDPHDRLQTHLDGQGNGLVFAAAQAGADVTIARTWINADRHFERYLKNGKNIGKRVCPACLGRTPQGKTENSNGHR
jgi:hypothetical protein